MKVCGTEGSAISEFGYTHSVNSINSSLVLVFLMDLLRIKNVEYHQTYLLTKGKLKFETLKPRKRNSQNSTAFKNNYNENYSTRNTQIRLAVYFHVLHQVNDLGEGFDPADKIQRTLTDLMVFH